ncbi:MAG TPA: cation-transporting P-type ATPase [Kofleriaceae bacterium]|nr:cation-transporting P-type ATPase [Kofleriaceae bacterium]
MLDDRELAAALVRHARASHRLRFEIATLFGDAHLARTIERDLGARSGVTRVRANPRSGRVLVELAPDAAILSELEHFAAPVVRRREGAPVGAAEAHSLDPAVVVRALRSSAHDGLHVDEAKRRLARHGENVLDGHRPTSRLALAARQLANVPTAILLSSALVSAVFGDLIEVGAIVTVVGLNATIGYRMERTSELLLEAWRTAEVGNAEVIRDGRPMRVNAAALVPGDLLLVRAGNIVPADARIVEEHRLLVDESALTGESEAVEKSMNPVAQSAALADRIGMLYRGTTVVGGHARAVVTATGEATELGTVQRLASAARSPKARLASRLDALAGRLAWSGALASGVSALASIAWRRSARDVMRDAVALSVAAIPEGLPVTTNAALVRAMARMRRRGIVVRRLGTTEALGGITVACADKTGTLTENRMRLEAVWIEGRRLERSSITCARVPVGPIAALLAASVLNSDLDYHRNHHGWHVTGSSTEQALAHAAIAAGIDPIELRSRFPRRRLIERSDQARYVVSEHELAIGGTLAVVKGAPEQVIELCEIMDGPILEENARMAAAGLRVLAVASRADAAPWRFLGLVALRDPLRSGAADAIRGAAHAGIRTVILTGDQRPTAEAIAREVGLTGEVIEGSELPAVLADDERLRQIAVVARVTPSDKVAVIEALRAAGEIVAMAGDGINDAPALHTADVGIAVGARSTDLARQTADIVLEHEDLRSILAAIGEGRIVQDNLRRSVRFQIAGNLGELLLITGGALVGRRVISPLGVLWINLLTDSLPGLAIALEPGEPDVLSRPAAPPGAPILDRDDWRRIARAGSAIATVSGIAALFGGPLSAFATIGASQFGYAAAQRTTDRVENDRRFAALIFGSAALHFAAVALSPARHLMRLAGPLPAALASFALALGAPLYLASRAGGQLVITRRARGKGKDRTP